MPGSDRARDDLYRSFIEDSSEGIWRIETEESVLISLPEDEQIERFYEVGYLAECNTAMAKMYGLTSSKDLIGARLGQFLVREDPHNQEYLRQFIRSGYRLNESESHEKDVSGNLRYFLNSLVGVVEEGELVRAWGMQRDITAQKETEHALRTSEARLHNLVEGVRDYAIFMLDSKGTVVSWNEGAERIKGYRHDEIIGQHASLFYDKKDTDVGTLSKALAIAQEEGRYEDEGWRVRKDGTRFWANTVITALYNEAGEISGYAAVTRDSTENKLAEQRIWHQAFHDPLTGLPNRKLLQERIETALAKLKRRHNQLAVLFMDLDGFKKVNDTYGHAIGDTLLREMATRFRDVLREGDTVARLGGDEFVVLLPEISSPDDAVQVAQKLIETTKRPLVLDKNKIRVTTSIGIAIHPEGGEHHEALLSNADSALYKAKQSGRNQHYLYKKEED